MSREIERRLTDAVGPRRRPVGIAFCTLPRVVAELATIAAANATLTDYHIRPRAELATEAP